MEGLHNGGRIRTSRDNEIILNYVYWILDECDSPVDEIEWLIFHSDDGVYESILDWDRAYNKKEESK